MMATATPSMEPNVAWGGRDITCLTIALAVHALLLLWKGGVFTMPNAAAPENVLVSVNFMSDVPSYEPPAAPAPKQSLFSKMKSLIRGEANPPKPKVDVFAQKPAVSKPDALEIAKGQNKEVSLVTAPPSVFKQTQQPKLKENNFKLATKDAPFKIASTNDQDALANVNAIPIQVGPKTTLSSRSFDNARTPALQSKTFAGRTGSTGEALAMGSASAVQTPALNSAANSNNTGATPVNTKATGRQWTSNSSFAGDNMNTLPRNSADGFDSPIAAGNSTQQKRFQFQHHRRIGAPTDYPKKFCQV